MKLQTYIDPNGAIATPIVIAELAYIDDAGRAFIRVGDQNVPLDTFQDFRGATSVPLVFATVAGFNADGSLDLVEYPAGGAVTYLGGNVTYLGAPVTYG